MKSSGSLVYTVITLAAACGGTQGRLRDGAVDAAHDMSRGDSAPDVSRGDGAADRRDASDAVDAASDGHGHIDAAIDSINLDATGARTDGSTASGCVGSWPQPAPSVAAPPLNVQARFLWMVPVANATRLTSADSGVAVIARNTLTIVDRDGNLIATIDDSTSTLPISQVAATSDGGLLYSDDRFAYRVDGATGQQAWRTMLGPNLNPSEFTMPATPVLDPSGKVYISGLDGNLWVLDAAGGSVLGTSSLGLAGSPHMIELGVGDVLFIDRVGISPGALGLYVPATGTWQSELHFQDTNIQPNAIAGFQIGIVEFGYIDTTAETTRTEVLDSCGNFRWTVPGDYSYPLVISFNDDLIVRDKIPLANQTYQYNLRRFSRDGALLASADQGNVTSATLGADDVLYFCNATGLVGLDKSLSVVFQIPLTSVRCSGEQVLSPEGRLFFGCLNSSGQSGICAVQTTSPGPAPVSWSREYERDSRSTFWLAP